MHCMLQDDDVCSEKEPFDDTELAQLSPKNV